MPVGKCQTEFADAARADGIVLIRHPLPGLNEAGHLGLPSELASAAAVLRGIFADLGGDEVDLGTGPHRPLQPDWFHDTTRTVIEVDEYQHFSSDRLRTVLAYPDEALLGFDRDLYLDLCRSEHHRADRYFFSRQARGFRWPGGRRAQRAYLDAVRDIAVPALGYAPVVRVPAIDIDGWTAYRRVRSVIQALARSGS